MNKTIILATIFAFSTFVSAEETITPDDATPVVNAFEALDTNLDGFVSLEEIGENEALINAFPELDLDQSGDLTRDEFSKFTMVAK